MEGFGVHTSMWTMKWTTRERKRRLPPRSNTRWISSKSRFSMRLRSMLGIAASCSKNNKLRSVCSLGLPEHAWASVHLEKAVEHLKVAIDKTADMGAEALSGVIFGGIGERTAFRRRKRNTTISPVRCRRVAKHAKTRGIELGVEAVNRYENHLINTGWQAVDMIERVGADNVFVHLDTYHMNIEEKGAANGILDAREHLKYIHLSESDRGTPGYGNVPWDEIYAALAAIGFKGGLAMESFINMPPQVAYGLAVWRPVAKDEAEVMGNGLPFLRNKARQYGLI